jgi:hypothetical protein
MDDEQELGQTQPQTEKTFDIFTGDKSGQLPLAKIKSSASSLENPQLQKKSGLFGRSKAPQPRKSVIPEVQ